MVAHFLNRNLPNFQVRLQYFTSVPEFQSFLARKDQEYCWTTCPPQYLDRLANIMSEEKNGLVSGLDTKTLLDGNKEANQVADESVVQTIDDSVSTTVGEHISNRTDEKANHVVVENGDHVVEKDTNQIIEQNSVSETSKRSALMSLTSVVYRESGEFMGTASSFLQDMKLVYGVDPIEMDSDLVVRISLENSKNKEIYSH